MIWINADDVMAIHSRVIQKSGGMDGLRDPDGLRRLSAPLQSFGGTELFPTDLEKTPGWAMAWPPITPFGRQQADWGHDDPADAAMERLSAEVEARGAVGMFSSPSPPVSGARRSCWAGSGPIWSPEVSLETENRPLRVSTRSGRFILWVLPVGVRPHQQAEHRLLDMKPVFRLLKDLRRHGPQRRRRQSLPPVGGQAVLHHGIRGRQGHQLLGQGEASQKACGAPPPPPPGPCWSRRR